MLYTTGFRDQSTGVRIIPKLTDFAKKETRNQQGMVNFPAKNSLSIQKKEILETNLFNTEKTDQNKSDKARCESLAQKFDENLIQRIDEAQTLLSEPVKNTLYFQLENEFNTPKNEIPDQIEKFIDILHKIFGLGASRLEIKFLKNLNSKIKLSNEKNDHECLLSNWILDDMSFTEYVERTRREYYTYIKNTGQS